MLTGVSLDNRFFIPPHRNIHFQCTTDAEWNKFCINAALEALQLLTPTTTCLAFYEYLAQRRMQFAKQQARKPDYQYIAADHLTIIIPGDEYNQISLDTELVETCLPRFGGFIWKIEINRFGLMRIGSTIAKFRSLGIYARSKPYWDDTDDDITTAISKTPDQGPYGYYWDILRANIQKIPNRESADYLQHIGQIILTRIVILPDTTILLCHTKRMELPALFVQYIEPLFAHIVNKSNPVTLEHFADLAWLLAHAMPCMRGSAAITQMVLFALMLHRGIEPLEYQDNMPDLDALTLPMEEFRTVFTQRLRHRSLEFLS